MALRKKIFWMTCKNFVLTSLIKVIIEKLTLIQTWFGDIKFLSQTKYLYSKLLRNLEICSLIQNYRFSLQYFFLNLLHFRAPWLNFRAPKLNSLGTLALKCCHFPSELSITFIKNLDPPEFMLKIPFFKSYWENFLKYGESDEVIKIAMTQIWSYH